MRHLSHTPPQTRTFCHACEGAHEHHLARGPRASRPAAPVPPTSLRAQVQQVGDLCLGQGLFCIRDEGFDPDQRACVLALVLREHTFTLVFRRDARVQLSWRTLETSLPRKTTLTSSRRTTRSCCTRRARALLSRARARALISFGRARRDALFALRDARRARRRRARRLGLGSIVHQRAWEIPDTEKVQPPYSGNCYVDGRHGSTGYGEVFARARARRKRDGFPRARATQRK